VFGCFAYEGEMPKDANFQFFCFSRTGAAFFRLLCKTARLLWSCVSFFWLFAAAQTQQLAFFKAGNLGALTLSARRNNKSFLRSALRLVSPALIHSVLFFEGYHVVSEQESKI
jgi:hypothetical protein